MTRTKCQGCKNSWLHLPPPHPLGALASRPGQGRDLLGLREHEQDWDDEWERSGPDEEELEEDYQQPWQQAIPVSCMTMVTLPSVPLAQSSSLEQSSSLKVSLGSDGCGEQGVAHTTLVGNKCIGKVI